MQNKCTLALTADYAQNVFETHKKCILKWTIKLNIKGKTVKLLGEKKIEKYPFFPPSGEGPKKTLKEKIETLDVIETKNYYLSKDPLN